MPVTGKARRQLREESARRRSNINPTGNPSTDGIIVISETIVWRRQSSGKTALFLCRLYESHTMTDDPTMSLRGRLGALRLAAMYRPRATVGVLLLGVVTAVFEGVGLTFILPIIEQVQTGGSLAQIDGLLGVFVETYQAVDVPFTLLYLILGALVMITVRYTARFALKWLRAWLRTDYLCDLKVRTFRAAVDSRIGYFDKRGSEEVLNSIVTQAKYGGFVIDKSVRITVESLQILIYLAIALYLAPLLTVGVLIFLGSIF